MRARTGGAREIRHHWHHPVRVEARNGFVPGGARNFGSGADVTVLGRAAESRESHREDGVGENAMLLAFERERVAETEDAGLGRGVVGAVRAAERTAS